MSIKLFAFRNFAIWIEDIIKLVADIPIRFVQENHLKGEENNRVKIYGVDIQTILEFIFIHKGLPNKEFLENIVKNNIIFTKISKLLKEKEIIIKGDKNKNILNPRMSIEDCIEKLNKSTINNEGYGSYSYNEFVT